MIDGNNLSFPQTLAYNPTPTILTLPRSTTSSSAFSSPVKLSTGISLISRTLSVSITPFTPPCTPAPNPIEDKSNDLLFSPPYTLFLICDLTSRWFVDRDTKSGKLG